MPYWAYIPIWENKQTTQVESNETRLEEITTGVTVKERKGWRPMTEGFWLCPGDWDDSSTNNSIRAVRRTVLFKENGQKWVVLDLQGQRWNQPYSQKSKTPGGQVLEIQTSQLPGCHMREKGEKQRAKGKKQKLHKLSMRLRKKSGQRRKNLRENKKNLGNEESQNTQQKDVRMCVCNFSPHLFILFLNPFLVFLFSNYLSFFTFFLFFYFF